MNRRDFIRSGAMSAAASICVKAQTPVAASLRFARPSVPVVVPADFIGLGYETSSPARLGLLSVKNTTYLNLVRGLGPHGTMRFGGIVGDHTQYSADGPPETNQDNTVMTRAALEQAAEFLRATGWKAVWSVNFGTGTLENAITELEDIASILGDRLLAVEIGNEVEAYKNGKAPHRPDGYTYAQYRAEYAKWHEAMVKALPKLRFYAPDTAQDVDWVSQMAADNAGTVQVLATHYYRANQRQAEADQLRSVDPKLADKVAKLRAASKASGLPWSICETNSYSGGGRPGISDTLLGALWTLDYMLYLASNGCAAVNIETGVNQLGFISSYSPIQDDGNGKNWAGVPYYGMLAARVALEHGRSVWTSTLAGAPETLTAYAFGDTDAGPSTVVLINRDAASDSVVQLPWSPRTKLYASKLAGTEKDVTFAEAAVHPDGTWQPVPPVKVSSSTVKVPHMSALVLTQTSTL